MTPLGTNPQPFDASPFASPLQSLCPLGQTRSLALLWPTRCDSDCTVTLKIRMPGSFDCTHHAPHRQPKTGLSDTSPNPMGRSKMPFTGRPAGSHALREAMRQKREAMRAAGKQMSAFGPIVQRETGTAMRRGEAARQPLPAVLGRLQCGRSGREDGGQAYQRPRHQSSPPLQRGDPAGRRPSIPTMAPQSHSASLSLTMASTTPTSTLLSTQNSNHGALQLEINVMAGSQVSSDSGVPAQCVRNSYSFLSFRRHERIFSTTRPEGMSPSPRRYVNGRPIPKT